MLSEKRYNGVESVPKRSPRFGFNPFPSAKKRPLVKQKAVFSKRFLSVADFPLGSGTEILTSIVYRPCVVLSRLQVLLAFGRHLLLALGNRRPNAVKSASISFFVASNLFLETR